ncbi:hypothetical protein BT67DRAFT_216810 [Trichocladium antarcticum]|uniref:Uncharacterized protein n=1 Tax=Trichocladium antarcticum TaxID=1450529 RepID=A0AAN6UD54_9PEZI|nr:hypothetical protein BT67DRAFT_216810 [Trichocladium antarcticum]
MVSPGLGTVFQKAQRCVAAWQAGRGYTGPLHGHWQNCANQPDTGYSRHAILPRRAAGGYPCACYPYCRQAQVHSTVRGCQVDAEAADYATRICCVPASAWSTADSGLRPRSPCPIPLRRSCTSADLRISRCRVWCPASATAGPRIGSSAGRRGRKRMVLRPASKASCAGSGMFWDSSSPPLILPPRWGIIYLSTTRLPTNGSCCWRRTRLQSPQDFHVFHDPNPSPCRPGASS